MDKKLNTTALNIALGLPGMSSVFTDSQLLRIRVVAVVSSGLSSFVGICAIYLLYNYDHRKKLFRHELISFLIICDFMKALILLLYPIILLIDKSSYASPLMIHTLGWFTQFATEGSDFAIGFFSIHFALLIFKPNWKWRNKKSGNIEGGLYKYRNFIWPITLLVPAIMASLVFIDFNVIDYVDLSTVNIVDDNNEYTNHFRPRRGGYKPWSAWSYLPARPLWYKYVLSWGPRYFLILMIITIYVSIYIYVHRETKKIKEQFRSINPITDHQNENSNDNIPFSRRFFINPLYRFFHVLLLIVTLNLDFSNDESIESKRSYSITPLSNQNSIHKNNTNNSKPNQSLHSVVPKKQNSRNNNNNNNNNNSNNNEEAISLESFYFNDATATSRKSNTIDPLPKESEGEITTSGNNTSISQDVSIRKTMSKITENAKLNSSIPTNEIVSISTETRSHENAFINSSKNINPSNTTNTDQGQNFNSATLNISDLQNQLQRENYAAMKKRRAQIQRNLRMIFIYPVSYMLVWAFSIAADISQTHHEMKYGPILWLTYADTFVRSMICLVHSFVFIFKEKPWKYSWKEVEEKILIDKYMLIGEIGEEEMQKLCQSKLGRRGWYYRSTWRKKNCWKHQNNLLRRLLWYIGRFFRRILTFKKPDFYDNCNDELYWSRYYYLDHDAGHLNTRTHSFSDSGLTSNVSSLIHYDHNNDQKAILELNSHHIEHFISPSHHFSNTQEPYCTEPQRKLLREVSIPWYWKMLHLLPLLHGIDLDELNRSVKLKYTNGDDDFIIPGLSFAFNANIISTGNNTTTNIPYNKTNFPSNKSKLEKSYNNKNYDGRNNSSVPYSVNGQIATVRLDSNQNYKSSSDRLNDTPEDEGEIDLLAFLNDPSTH